MPEPMPAALSGALDHLFAAWNLPDSPGAALAVVRDGRTVYQQGYGLANLEHTVPITAETVFHTASIAKQMTAVAILLLAEDRALSLDDEIHKHLPDLPDFGHQITLRHLLQHTSGLRDQWELLTLAGWRMDDVITQAHILRLVRRQRELNFPPGTAFSYCNTGYTLLAEVVARVSGQSLRRFAQVNIFEPLGMRHTLFCDNHEEIVPNRSCSYYPASDGRGFRKSVLSYANAGATSLLTTAADLAKWIANFEHPVVGSPEILRQMQEPAVLANGDTVAYGCGLALGTYRGQRILQHIGIDAGYRSFVCWFPELHVGAAVLANLSAIDVRSLATRAVELVLGGEAEWAEPEAAPAPGAQPGRIDISSDLLDQYVGRYYSEELDATYWITAADGGLVVRHLMRDDLFLAPTAPDTFAQLPAGFPAVRFMRAGQTVIGFRLDGARLRNLWFERLPT